MRMPALLCLSLSLASLTALSQTTRATLPDSKAVVLRSEAELWNKGNLAVADELYSPNFLCHFVAGSEWKGVEDLKRQVVAIRTAFPDWNERVDDIVVEGDRVAIRFRSTGTQRGVFEGMAPTGRRVSLVEAAFFRVVDGKLARAVGICGQPVDDAAADGASKGEAVESKPRPVAMMR